MKKLIVVLVTLVVMAVAAIEFWPKSTEAQMREAVNEVRANIAPKRTEAEQAAIDKAVQEGKDLADREYEIEKLQEEAKVLEQDIAGTLDQYSTK